MNLSIFLYSRQSATRQLYIECSTAVLLLSPGGHVLATHQVWLLHSILQSYQILSSESFQILEYSKSENECI